MEVYDTIQNETSVKDGAVRYAATKLGVLKAKERLDRGHWWWALPQHREELEGITGSSAQDYSSNELPRGVSA
jgi:hypothetical protein